MSTVYERYIAGEYTTKLEYPDRVSEPAVLRKRAKELTAEELASIPAVAAQYEADKIAYKAGRIAHGEDQGRLNSQLQADLEAENDVTGNPKAALLWQKAYERGHSGGMGEVMNVYIDLVDLIQ